jgi:hypothetical protein
MITDKQYKDALTIVDEYRKQLKLSFTLDSSKADIYEWVKSEMMIRTDITLEEFEEVVEVWCHDKKKELSIEDHEKYMSKFII